MIKRIVILKKLRLFFEIVFLLPVETQMSIRVEKLGDITAHYEKMFLQNNDNSQFMNHNFIISFVVHS